MTCAKCGAALNGWNAACPSCGEPAPAAPAENAAEAPRPGGAVSAAEVLYRRVIGLIAAAGGGIFLALFAANLFRFGFFSVSPLAAALKLILPLGLLAGGGAAFFWAARPEAGGAGALAAGTGLLLACTDQFAGAAAGRIGDAAAAAWAVLWGFILGAAAVFLGLAWLVQRSAGADARRLLAVPAAAGLLAGAAMFFLSVPAGRALGILPSDALAYFVSMARVWAAAVPAAAAGTALNALLVRRGSRAFAAVVLARAAVLVPLIYILVFVVQLGPAGIGFAILAAELLGAAVSAFLVRRGLNGKGSGHEL